MYPNFRELFYYTLGVDIQFLALINTFGFFVAMAFVAAAWLLSNELKRKEREGLIHPTQAKIITGLPATPFDIASAALLGFLVGFKVLGLAFNMDWSAQSPQQFILSTQGNWIGGILLGGAFGYFTWRDKEKQKLDKPKEEIILIHPFQLVGNITVIAAVAGILGAKLFHHLENWDDFVKDPIGELSNFFGGLTFYGGLIVATVAVVWYVRKNGIKPIHIFDATAPSLILAYGIGRIGCMVAGDGDWGVINSAYRIDADRNITEAAASDSIKQEIAANFNFYDTDAETPEQVPYIYFKQPEALSFLPTTFFAYDFPHNVLESGTPLNNCDRRYCSHLPLPVFPTPFYEVLMALSIFGLLWSIRKRIKVPGMLFGIYLVFNGLERFLIEKIRVNTLMDFLGMKITQAELISSILFLIGLGVIAFTYTRSKAKKAV